MSEEITAPRQVQRIRHEIKRRALEVRRVETLSPQMRRVVFGGEALADFVSASFDDHVKIFFPAGGESVARDYTPRHYDPAVRELTVDFALHGDGPAADWARQAAVGQPLTVAGPRGSFVVPLDFDWYLLVGDETALPAIARRLEELPAGSRAIVRLYVAEVDRLALGSAATVDLQWADDDAALLDALRALELPAGFGYAWCAAEAGVAAQARKILVDEKGHDRRAIRAASYWKRGAIAHHENLEEPR
ncbi:siderophore-interacting protein [Pseudorhodoferax sp. Leaf267]|uniref:siderophore-interacting protein n=1 Tax=Pseudorhodoferax sp. Leaf267 TaxID=1736316 RepID=UPI0006F5C4B0|nr:siderophore-interacting protein [Pseudorhodoferax sp. Leaf267]KQP15113.1 FAD-binding protein [Pseudorhodoferax sp. Leaf267]